MTHVVTYSVLFYLAMLKVWQANTINVIPNRACEIHYKHGDVIIGGIFPIYYTENTPCDGDRRTKRISMVESLTYAVGVVNARPDILANITVGYEIRNDCSNEEISLWTMMTMTSGAGNVDYTAACPEPQYRSRAHHGKVAGVIGTSRSSTSLLAAKVGGVYGVPIVSYYATSDELSDVERFPYFFRTVPPDKFQVHAIVDVLLRFDWKYVALFYSIDSYGIHGARQIQTLAETLGICIAVNLPVSNKPSQTEVRDIADRLLENEKVRVIVVFSLWKSAKAVLQAVTEYGIDRSLTFIGSDGWGPDVDEVTPQMRKLLHGGIFVRLSAQSSRDFHEYYQRLPEMQEHASQWYRDVLQDIQVAHDCTDWVTCPIPTPHLETRIMNGVFALAFALHASVKAACPSGEFCEEALGANLQRHLLDVSFTRTNAQFAFDENGDPSGKYVLQNWQRTSGHGEAYSMVDVGVWDPMNATASALYLDVDRLQWGTPDGEVVTSLCVEECGIGYVAVPLEKKCCWGCHKCPAYAITANDSSECHECEITEWPDDNRTNCAVIIPMYLGPDDPVILLTLVFSGVGLVLTILVGLALWHWRQHQVVKASSIELSCVNIIGLTLTCVAAIMTSFLPAPMTCIAMDVVTSVAVCVTFTPILLKVNRIWRIFSSAKKSAQRPRYINAKHQLGIIAVIVTVQVNFQSLSFSSQKPFYDVSKVLFNLS